MVWIKLICVGNFTNEKYEKIEQRERRPRGEIFVELAYNRRGDKVARAGNVLPPKLWENSATEFSKAVGSDGTWKQEEFILQGYFYTQNTYTSSIRRTATWISTKYQRDLCLSLKFFPTTLIVWFFSTLSFLPQLYNIFPLLIGQETTFKLKNSQIKNKA